MNTKGREAQSRVELGVQAKMELDPYQYFRGGPDGIRERFADRFRSVWNSMALPEQEWFSNEFRDYSEAIGGILSKPCKYEAVNCGFVRAVAAPLRIEIDEVCGAFLEFDSAAAAQWKEAADQNGFYCLCGNTRQALPIVKMFVMDMAIERL